MALRHLDFAIEAFREIRMVLPLEKAEAISIPNHNKNLEKCYVDKSKPNLLKWRKSLHINHVNVLGLNPIGRIL